MTWSLWGLELLQKTVFQKSGCVLKVPLFFLFFCFFLNSSQKRGPKRHLFSVCGCERVIHLWTWKFGEQVQHESSRQAKEAKGKAAGTKRKTSRESVAEALLGRLSGSPPLSCSNPGSAPYTLRIKHPTTALRIRISPSCLGWMQAGLDPTRLSTLHKG